MYASTQQQVSVNPSAFLTEDYIYIFRVKNIT